MYPLAGARARGNGRRPQTARARTPAHTRARKTSDCAADGASWNGVSDRAPRPWGKRVASVRDR
eukprot:2244852-Lingulodinium_polyedra.AAC.1